MLKLNNAVVYHGSNLDVLPTLPDNSVDSIVTDPPYELGFMGKSWDSSGIAYSVELWTECMRVLKPGGHLLAFGGSRTWHRLAVAIEDAGFEMRDSIAWLYGSGFPKSMDISKAIDKNNGKPRNLTDFTLWLRTTGVTVKQVTQVLRDAKLISDKGTMASHYFASSEAGQPAIPTVAIWQFIRPLIAEVPEWVDEMVARIEAEREVIGSKTAGMGSGKSFGMLQAEGVNSQAEKEIDITAPATTEAIKWQGWGTALKPAFEPVVVARKPFKGTVASNVLEWGVGGLNIDGSRIGTFNDGAARSNSPGSGRMKSGGGNLGTFERSSASAPLDENQGRWPANIILDPYTAELLDEQSGISTGKLGMTGKTGTSNSVYGNYPQSQNRTEGVTDSGGASRFFYVAKASKRDRNEGLDGLPEVKAGSMSGGEDMREGKPTNHPMRQNFHPTVKPTSLMEYLIKLVTPEGGTVLDPFTGSGSTGKAALLNGYQFIGIELTEEYLPIIEGRLKWANEQRKNLTDTPLF